MTMLKRSKEWWQKVCASEPDGFISAGCPPGYSKDYSEYLAEECQSKCRVKRSLSGVGTKAAPLTASLLASTVIIGCQTTKPQIVTKVVERKVEVPKSLLTCSPEPTAGTAWISQKDVARYLNRVAEAGNDCRVKLRSVRNIIENKSN